MTGRRQLSVPRLSILVACGLLLVTTATPVAAQTSDDVKRAGSDRDAAYQSVTIVKDEM
jgi:hypothetical protein